MVAAWVFSTKGYISVAACYNPLGAVSYQEFTHYLSHLPPPVIFMSDFSIHYRCWEPILPLHHTNTSGRVLFQFIMDFPRLSLLSPSGFPTRYHFHTNAPAVLGLFFIFFTSATGPLMGSDHLSVLASFPCVPAETHPGYLPRWKLIFSGWPAFTKTLYDPPDFFSLRLEEEVFSLAITLVEAGQKAFHLSTHRTRCRSGKL